jgi:hypothetical protein
VKKKKNLAHTGRWNRKTWRLSQGRRGVKEKE